MCQPWDSSFLVSSPSEGSCKEYVCECDALRQYWIQPITFSNVLHVPKWKGASGSCLDDRSISSTVSKSLDQYGQSNEISGQCIIAVMGENDIDSSSQTNVCIVSINHLGILLGKL